MQVLISFVAFVCFLQRGLADISVFMPTGKHIDPEVRMQSQALADEHFLMKKKEDTHFCTSVQLPNYEQFIGKLV